MANPNVNTHSPILAVATVSGNQEQIFNYLQGSGQTYTAGSPVMESSGAMVVWSGTVGNATTGPSNLITGIAPVQGYNYASAGLGASSLYGSVGFPGAPSTFGSVPNQPSAVNIFHGAPYADGLTLVQLAVTDTIFEAQVDASSGSTFNATTAIIGTQLGLTKDSNNFWYVDLAKATAGTNTVLTIVSLNPQDLVSGSTVTGITNGRVRFRFNPLQTSVQGG